MRRYIAPLLIYFWQSKTFLHVFLLPISFIFWFIISIRRIVLTTFAQKISIPVVVIGNITVGGNGKTPFVIALTQFLQKKGLSVGIVSKGYGRKNPHQCFLINKPMPTDVIGDEVALIWQKTSAPLAVGPSRIQACDLLIDMGCDVVLCDDGLQDYSLSRDIEIIMQSDHSEGNGLLLPIGPYREPKNRMARAFQIIRQVKNNTMNNKAHQMRYEIEHIKHLSSDTCFTLSNWSGSKNVTAISAIANPDRFHSLLIDSGFNISCYTLPDHDVITTEDLHVAGNNTIFITEKDAVKLSSIVDADVWIISIKPTFSSPVCEPILKRLLFLYPQLESKIMQ
ncbi:MAG: tetraacyldisaccharide 4'-kinase [Pseudomonadota bacterium]|nr:tetraacyldisaccharide 4'-kinase [Pseudomonadota bacterium]